MLDDGAVGDAARQARILWAGLQPSICGGGFWGNDIGQLCVGAGV